MIVFELICPGQHRFEGWFASADDFESQKSRGLLACPSCGHSEIEKLLTAKIRTLEAAPGGQRATTTGSLPAKGQQTVTLHEIIDHVLRSTEDVGPRFAAEARRIFRDEAANRGIRGTASRQETEDLLDEGIPVVPLPIPPQGSWH